MAIQLNILVLISSLIVMLLFGLVYILIKTFFSNKHKPKETVTVQWIEEMFAYMDEKNVFEFLLHQPIEYFAFFWVISISRTEKTNGSCNDESYYQQVYNSNIAHIIIFI
jgi:hypothetical protein